MPSSMTRRSLARLVVSILCLVVALVSCAKDPLRVDRNRPPETYLVGAPAESAGASYRIHLYWRGEDPDGYISGFYWSWDDSTIGALRFTTKTDSIFELAVNDSSALFGGGTQQPGQTKPHTFFIRAVDNLGKADPTFSIFSKRVYKATTDKPVVRFVGAIPSGALQDTLCDGQPFKLCWTGSDADGYVNYYRWDVGIFSSGLSADTCAVFNDPNDPESVNLISGVYTFTVTAVDNAFSRSDPATGGRTQFVVNNDPDTEILPDPQSADPRAAGYYIQPFSNGQPAPPITHTFYEGDTVPYRSTVWWNWTAQDEACDNPQGITGYAAFFLGGHNNFEPYTTGYQYHLCNSPDGDPIYFTTNNPAVVNTPGVGCSFPTLVLDSLDVGHNQVFVVSARDNSGRADGSPASFRFSCNFPPTASNLTVQDTTSRGQPAKLFRWVGLDPEDGLTRAAQFVLDGTSRQDLENSNEQQVIILESEFRLISSLGPHRLTVRVKDRAEAFSEPPLSIEFDISP
jgi:hypothetical protein